MLVTTPVWNVCTYFLKMSISFPNDGWIDQQGDVCGIKDMYFCFDNLFADHWYRKSSNIKSTDSGDEVLIAVSFDFLSKTNRPKI